MAYARLSMKLCRIRTVDVLLMNNEGILLSMNGFCYLLYVVIVVLSGTEHCKAKKAKRVSKYLKSDE